MVKDVKIKQVITLITQMTTCMPVWV